MSLEIGSEVEGIVTGITHFGAFVKLPEGNTGLIHISELADAYVEDVRQYLNEKDKIIVKVLGVNNKGKYDLSLKQVEQKGKTEKLPQIEKPPHREERKSREDLRNASFEDKLSKFMKESEERLLDLKRNTEAKRGRGRGR